MDDKKFDAAGLLAELDQHLDGLASFWRARGVDPAGGYHVVFDRDGNAQPEPVKTLVAQTRALWTYSALAQRTGDEALIDMAKHGLDYLVRRFHDEKHGGWYWSVGADRPADPAKLMYGQSFALYALCAYASVTGDRAAADLAAGTFDAMHQAADLAYGGFWENIDEQWAPEDTESGRRKSLDIHMHLLESFTALAKLTGGKTHRRRLAEIRHLILTKLMDNLSGVGGNQFDAAFEPLEPIVIDRTWIAERNAEEAKAPGHFTVSYGHNLELGWLLADADELLDDDRSLHTALVDHMAAHAMRFGFDNEFGGIYREGPPLQPATDTDKEFWQNAEALIGFLHAYELTGNQQYAQAMAATWRFDRRYLVHPVLAEWRIRTTRDGTPVDDSLGNQWTGGYHTVRAALECTHRLVRMLGDALDPNLRQ